MNDCDIIQTTSFVVPPLQVHSHSGTKGSPLFLCRVFGLSSCFVCFLVVFCFTLFFHVLFVGFVLVDFLWHMSQELAMGG